MKWLLVLFAFFLSIQVLYAAKPGDQAIAWAVIERDRALGTVMAAEKRVDAAETDLRISRSVEQDIRSFKDSEALAVAREAVSVSEQGIKEANVLLKRARELLIRQENVLISIQSAVEAGGADKAMIVPLSGEVRRSYHGGQVTSDFPSQLRAGERVEVGARSSAKLFIARGDAEVDLTEKSSFTVTRDDTSESFEAVLNEGFAHIKAKLKNYFGKKFEVRTPTAVVAVRGTDFSIRNIEGGSRIEVSEGVVWIRLPEKENGVEVHAGEGCTVLKDGGIQTVQRLENQGNVHAR